MVSTSAKKLINIATFIMLFLYFFTLYLSLVYTVNHFYVFPVFTKICNKKITFQCKIFIVPEEGWFGQPKYSTHIKTFLRCAGFCLYFLRSQLIRFIYLLRSLSHPNYAKSELVSTHNKNDIIE